MTKQIDYIIAFESVRVVSARACLCMCVRVLDWMCDSVVLAPKTVDVDPVSGVGKQKSFPNAAHR